MLQSAVRVFLLVLLSLLSAGRAFADWQLGSQLLGPAPGSRTQASVAAGSHDALAVWSDSRSGNEDPDLLAVRMDARGEPLATIRVQDRNPWGWMNPPLVASDGESYLVLWAKTRMWAATIDRQNHVTTRELELSLRPMSVTWNGSRYLVTSGNRMVLLDRDGSLASGVLSLGALAEYPVLTAASRGGRWLVINTQASRSGMISAGDFPPIGTEQQGVLPDPHPAGATVLTTWGAGYASVRANNLQMSVGVYDADGRLLETENVAVARPIVDPQIRIRELGGALYVAYGTAANVTEVVRLSKQGRRTARLRPRPEDASGYSVSSLGSVQGLPGALVATNAGVLSVWSSAADHQIYRALVTSPAFRRGGIRLSADRARQRSPRIASMPGAHLVAWVEHRAAAVVVVAVLSDDARQAGEPVPLPLAADNNEPPYVATDGVNFLVVSKSAGAYQGVIVSREGKVQVQPFEVPVTRSSEIDLFSLVWNGVAYAATGPGQTTLVATNGTILRTDSTEHEYGDYGPYGQFLARDGDRMLVVNCEPDWPTITGPIGIEYTTSVRRADLTPLPPENAVDQAWTGRRLESAVDRVPPAPAIAAGGGHRLIARREWEWAGRSPELRPMEVMGDSHTHIEQVPHGPALHAVWNGSGFFVAVGSTLLRHAPSGELVERLSLGDGILESNVGIGSVPFVVMLREAGVPRLFVRPLEQ